MKKEIQKINDHVYSNVQNVGVIISYSGDFITDRSALTDFLKVVSANNFQLSLDVLKYQGVKKYYIQVWNGFRGNYNNVLSENRSYGKSKHWFTTKIDELMMHPFLRGKAELEKEFTLFDNHKLDRKFEDIFYDPLAANKKAIEAERNRYITEFYANFLKGLGTDQKKGVFDNGVFKDKIKFLSENSLRNFDISINVDSILGEELYNFIVGNEFVTNYFLLFDDKIVKDERVGSFDPAEFMDYLEQESVGKYLLRFAFDTDSDGIEVVDKTTGKYRLRGESDIWSFGQPVGEFYGFTTSLFVFSKKPDLGGLMGKMQNKFHFEVVNPEAKYDASPFYIQDNSYLGRNFIDSSRLSDFFRVMKRYEYRNEGVFMGREYYSNVPLKFYPHRKAGIDERGMLQKSFHTAICSVTGGGKSEFAINFWKQLGTNGTKGLYIDNIGGLEDRIRFYNPSLEFTTISWGVDSVGFKTRMLEKIVGVSSIDSEYGNKKEKMKAKLDSTEDYSERFKVKHEMDEIEKEHATMKSFSGQIGASLVSYCDLIASSSGMWNLRDFTKKFIDNISASNLPDFAKKYFVEHVSKNVSDEAVRRFSLRYDNVNPIGRMGTLANFGIDEIGEKTEMISTFLGIDDIENPEARDFAKAAIQKYLGTIPYGKFFNWDAFSKSFTDSVSDESIGITGIVRMSLLSKLNIQKNYRNLFNSETDFIETLESTRLGVLDIASISKNDEKNRKYQFMFFNLLYQYVRLVRPGGGISHVFFEEFHNYLPSEGTVEGSASWKVSELVGKMIRESRNFSTAFFLISQKLQDFLANGILDSVKQLFLFDLNTVNTFFNIKRFEKNAVFAQYVEDYQKAFMSGGFSYDANGNLVGKSDFRIGFAYNEINDVQECFITRVVKKDFTTERVK